MDVQIRQLPPTRVAYMRHTGAYGTAGIPRLWQRFAAWCAGQGLMQPRRTMYGISQDNPEITPPDRCRYDVCVEVSDDFLPDGEVGVQTLRGGRYACARFVGTSEDIHAAWADLCGRWLPDSGYQADDAPGIEIYESDFVMDEHTGAFSCWLCIPVRVL